MDGSMDGFRFCGCTEEQLAIGRRRQSKWRKRHLKWYIADRLPGMSVAQQVWAFNKAFSQWQEVCGLVFEQTYQHANADFLILTRGIDGRNGTLAEHQLPPGDDRTLRGWYDIGEQWDPRAPIAPGQIDLVAVACHEIGHGIGMPHLRTAGSLLNPYYDPNITKPQRADIEFVRDLYGPPVATPAPDPTPAPTPDPPTPGPDPTPTPTPEQIEITVKLGGITYGGLTLDRQG